MSQRADEAAALYLWGDGQPVSFAAVGDHVAACAACAGANPQHVWVIVNNWQRSITATRVRARR